MDLAFACHIPNAIPDWTSVKNFMKQFITSYLPIGVQQVRVALVTYGYSDAQVQFNLSRYTLEDDVNYAIDTVSFSPNNFYGDPTWAFQTLRLNVFQSGARANVQKVAVVMLDTLLVNQNGAVTQAQLLESSGVDVVVVDIMNSVGKQSLLTLVNKTTDIIVANGYTYLQSRVPQLATEICYPDSNYGEIIDTNNSFLI